MLILHGKKDTMIQYGFSTCCTVGAGSTACHDTYPASSAVVSCCCDVLPMDRLVGCSFSGEVNFSNNHRYQQAEKNFQEVKEKDASELYLCNCGHNDFNFRKCTVSCGQEGVFFSPHSHRWTTRASWHVVHYMHDILGVILFR